VLAALDWLPDKISIRITGERLQPLAEKQDHRLRADPQRP
jgi:hypothetical protein